MDQPSDQVDVQEVLADLRDQIGAQAMQHAVKVASLRRQLAQRDAEIAALRSAASA